MPIWRIYIGLDTYQTTLLSCVCKYVPISDYPYPAAILLNIAAPPFRTAFFKGGITIIKSLSVASMRVSDNLNSRNGLSL
jgi:hypothetical protein